MDNLIFLQNLGADHPHRGIRCRWPAPQTFQKSAARAGMQKRTMSFWHRPFSVLLFTCLRHSVFPLSSAQGCVNHGLNGMHTVLRLVEHDGLWGLEDLVRDLHLRNTWKEGRQCMKMAVGLAFFIAAALTW